MLVIAISGKKGAGKTTLARHLIKALEREDIEATKFSFATPLKKHVAKILSLSLTELEIMKNHPEITFWYDKKVMNVRDILKQVGDELRSLDEDIFVKAMINKINNETNDVVVVEDLVVIDDMRFKNEFGGLTENFDVVSVRVSTDIVEDDDDTHKSETDLDDAKFDIYFNRDEKPLEDAVKGIVDMVVWNKNI